MAESRPHWLRMCVTALALALPTLAPLLGATTAAAAGAPHIMVIVEENQGYSNIIGNSKAPYINSLAHKYASATRWYGLTDSSLADYVALISGTTGSYSSPTLVGELAASGISWKAYMEDMPSACYTGAVGNYEKVHNPFVYFNSITSNPAQCNRIVPFGGSGGFASDLKGNTAPSFMFVVPNVCDDMHSACSSAATVIQRGDSWLQTNLSTVFASQWYASGGIVIITWDSAKTTDTSGWNTGSGGHVPTLVISAASSGAFGSGGNHYGTLRAIEGAYGVGLLGKSSSPANGDLAPAF